MASDYGDAEVEEACVVLWSALAKSAQGVVIRAEFARLYALLVRSMLGSAEVERTVAAGTQHYIELDRSGVLGWLREAAELYCAGGGGATAGAVLALLAAAAEARGLEASAALPGPAFKASAAYESLEAGLLDREARLHEGDTGPTGGAPSDGAGELEAMMRASAQGLLYAAGAGAVAARNSQTAVRAVLGAVAGGCAPRVWVVGPPSSGKSSLSRELAARTGARLVCAGSEPSRAELADALASGCGYVIDGGHDSARLVAELEQASVDVAPHVLVELSGDPADLAARLAAVRIDPASGRRFLGAEWRAAERKRVEAAAKKERIAARKAAKAARATAGEDLGPDAELSRAEEEEEEEEEEEKKEDEEDEEKATAADEEEQQQQQQAPESAPEADGEAKEDQAKEGELTISPAKGQLKSKKKEHPLAYLDRLEACESVEAAYARVEASLAALDDLRCRLVEERPAGRRLRHLRIEAVQPLAVIQQQVLEVLSDARQGEPLCALAFAASFNRAQRLVPAPAVEASGEDAEEGAASGAEPAAGEPARLGAEAEAAARSELLYNVPLTLTLPDLALASKEAQDDEGDEPSEPATVLVSRPVAYSFRRLSPWGFSCPVSRQEGQARYSALFRGCIYFCSSEAALASFLKAPQAFASAQPRSAGRVVLVAGPSVSGLALRDALAAMCSAHGWVADDRSGPAPEAIESEEAYAYAYGKPVAPAPAHDDGAAPAVSAEADATAAGAASADATALYAAEDATGAESDDTGAAAATAATAAAAAADDDLAVAAADAPPALSDVSAAKPVASLRSLAGLQWIVCLRSDAEPAALFAEAQAAGESVRKVVVIASLTSAAPAGDDKEPAAESEDDKFWVRWRDAARAAGAGATCVADGIDAAARCVAAADFAQEPDAARAAFTSSENVTPELVDACLGWSGRFCPVALLTRGRLIPGDAERRVMFGQAFYRFSDAQAQSEFIKAPERFATPPTGSAGEARLRPLVLLLGAAATGKSMAAADLGAAFGLQVLDRQGLQQFVSAATARAKAEAQALAQAKADAQAASAAAAKSAAAAAAPEAEQGDPAYGEDQERQGSEATAAAAAAAATAAAEATAAEPSAEAEVAETPEAAEARELEQLVAFLESRLADERAAGWVIDGLIGGEAHAQKLLRLQLHPSLVLATVSEEDIAVKRLVARDFNWAYTPPAPPAREEGEEGEKGEAEPEPEPAPSAEQLAEMRSAAQDAFEAAARERVAAASEACAAALAALSGAGVQTATLDMNGRTGRAHALRLARSAVRNSVLCSVGQLAAPRAVAIARPELAVAMLDSGLAVASLGSCCPVALTTTGRRERAGPGAALMLFEGELFSVAAGSAAAFAADPARFARSAAVRNATAAGPDAQVRPRRRCAVVGSDTARCVAVAGELHRATGVQVITVANAVAFAQAPEAAWDAHSGDSAALATAVRVALAEVAGDAQELPSSLLARCIARRVAVTDARLDGFALSGFPRSERELRLLEEVGVHVDVVLVLQTAQRRLPEGLLEIERAASEIGDDRLFYLPPEGSPWALGALAADVLDRRADAALRAATGASDTIASVVDDRQQRVDASMSSRGRCSALSARMLLAARKLPSSSGAFCPVAFQRSKALVKASCAYRAVCGGKLYSFADAEAQRAFLADATPFVSVVPELAAAAERQPPSPESLLEAGERAAYLERTLAPFICKALEQLGQLRPKHPSLTVTQSGSAFVALALRAANPEVSPESRARREEQLATFVRECELISIGAPRGSGLKAVRHARSAQQHSGDNKINNNDHDDVNSKTEEKEQARIEAVNLDRFHLLLSQSAALLRARLT